MQMTVSILSIQAKWKCAHVVMRDTGCICRTPSLTHNHITGNTKPLIWCIFVCVSFVFSIQRAITCVRTLFQNSISTGRRHCRFKITNAQRLDAFWHVFCSLYGHLETGAHQYPRYWTIMKTRDRFTLLKKIGWNIRLLRTEPKFALKLPIKAGLINYAV